MLNRLKENMFKFLLPVLSLFGMTVSTNAHAAFYIDLADLATIPTAIKDFFIANIEPILMVSLAMGIAFVLFMMVKRAFFAA